MKERLLAGATARDVGIELGCSRNAVISIAHRRGLAFGRAKVAKAPVPETKQRTPRAASAPPVPDVRLLCEIDELPVAAGVRIADLRARHCRWVAAPGAPWVFCGEPRERGSYCAAHARMVYVKESAIG